ncbi:hypothetical protein C8R45DRAFT_1071440 [Mycena sanguinolenta]|nr:hypothetical protein C8R45DRAFT_1071440 [Mycena sanguinolenta]
MQHAGPVQRLRVCVLGLVPAYVPSVGPLLVPGCEDIEVWRAKEEEGEATAVLTSLVESSQQASLGDSAGVVVWISVAIRKLRARKTRFNCECDKYQCVQVDAHVGTGIKMVGTHRPDSESNGYCDAVVCILNRWFTNSGHCDKKRVKDWKHRYDLTPNRTGYPLPVRNENAQFAQTCPARSGPALTVF